MPVALGGIAARLAGTLALAPVTRKPAVRYETDRSLDIGRGGGVFSNYCACACLGSAVKAATIDPVVTLRDE